MDMPSVLGTSALIIMGLVDCVAANAADKTNKEKMKMAKVVFLSVFIVNILIVIGDGYLAESLHEIRG